MCLLLQGLVRKMRGELRMRRSFLPVGQGAFYLEQFDKRTFGTDAVIIYDCGSLTSVDRVKEQIENC